MSTTHEPVLAMSELHTRVEQAERAAREGARAFSTLHTLVLTQTERSLFAHKLLVSVLADIAYAFSDEAVRARVQIAEAPIRSVLYESERALEKLRDEALALTSHRDDA